MKSRVLPTALLEGAKKTAEKKNLHLHYASARVALMRCRLRSADDARDPSAILRKTSNNIEFVFSNFVL